MKERVIIFVLLCLAAVRGECNADFSRYQVILNRMPFGSEPSPADLVVAAKPVAPQEMFTKNLKMCAVTRNMLTGKLQVGLVDTVAKKNYFMEVGETEDGITVVDADYDAENALLKKGNEEVRLGMSDAVAMATVAAPQSQARPGMGGRPAITVSVPRHQVIRESKVEPPRLTGEALTKHLQNYQMELIRAGGEKGPPLPMELTPEMDKQLVEEGVLPPVE